MMLEDFYPDPLPQNALQAVYDGLDARGFNRQTMTEEMFPLDSNANHVLTANVVAFTHPSYRNPYYRAVTVINFSENVVNEGQLAQTLSFSAAPFHIIHRKDKKVFNVWYTGSANPADPQPQSTRVEKDISYSNLSVFLERNAADISPTKITKVKQGLDTFKHFNNTGAYQLSLWAIDVTKDKLVESFGRAISSARQINQNSEIVTDIAIQVLAAIILWDTKGLTATKTVKRPSLDELIKAASSRFGKYFNLGLLSNYRDTTGIVFNILSEINHSGFAPEMLTELYRKAYPEDEARKSGRFDTPLYLTRRICEQIPFEFLTPEARICADITCGWGSFLISAHERLSGLTDMQGWDLNQHIFGNDKDYFTSRLSGLSLLTSTRQDSWQIDAEDGLTWNPPKKPYVILGNPPFGGDRGSIKEGEHEHRFERANSFLRHAIDLVEDGGYIGMIMPGSFPSSEASSSVRKYLREECDILELWELPYEIFEATVNPTVIFAQKSKNDRKAFPVRIRRLEKLHLKNFQDEGAFTNSVLVKSQEGWDQNSITIPSNQFVFEFNQILSRETWNKVQFSSMKLQDVALVFNGIVEGKNLDRKRMKDFEDGKKIQWYTGMRSVIQETFFVRYQNPIEKTYPNDFEEPRFTNQHFFEKSKVLINKSKRPVWGQRITVAIDRKGVYVSDNFNVIALRDDIKLPNHMTLEVVAAVVGWKIANAWITEWQKSANLPLTKLRQIPFPHLTPAQSKQITQAVKNIENAKQAGLIPDDKDTNVIDAVLKEAYNLDDETYHIVTGLSDWKNSHLEQNENHSSAQRELLRKVCGVVESVNANDNTLTLWLRGFDDFQKVSIVDSMPGWLLREGVAFCTEIPKSVATKETLDGDVKWGKFAPQEYAYMDEDDLLDSLSNIFSVQ